MVVTLDLSVRTALASRNKADVNDTPGMRRGLRAEKAAADWDVAVTPLKLNQLNGESRCGQPSGSPSQGFRGLASLRELSPGALASDLAAAASNAIFRDSAGR